MDPPRLSVFRPDRRLESVTSLFRFCLSSPFLQPRVDKIRVMNMTERITAIVLGSVWIPKILSELANQKNTFIYFSMQHLFDSSSAFL